MCKHMHVLPRASTWLLCVSMGVTPTPRSLTHLQRVLGADGEDLVLEVAELAAPRAPLADPADEAGLVRAAHGPGAPARAQQLPLQEGRKTPRIRATCAAPPNPSQRRPTGLWITPATLAPHFTSSPQVLSLAPSIS